MARQNKIAIETSHARSWRSQKALYPLLLQQVQEQDELITEALGLLQNVLDEKGLLPIESYLA